jgi:hypothetical protein
LEGSFLENRLHCSASVMVTSYRVFSSLAQLVPTTGEDL